jgi:hypothetical protein
MLEIIIKLQIILHLEIILSQANIPSPEIFLRVKIISKVGDILRFYIIRLS